MRVAVIGATGFIGRHLCDAYLESGDEVSALIRDPQVAKSFSRKGIAVTIGGLCDEEAITRMCTNASVVFNVAGALGKWNTPLGELEEVNTHAAGRVVRCAASAGAGRVIHTSTAGVSGPLAPDVCADEDYPARPVTDYQRTKHVGELGALQAQRETGIPLTIVRPAFVYGPGDSHKLSLFRAISKSRMVLVNGGTSRLHPAYVDDVVAGMICAAECAPGRGEVYILGGDAPATTREITTAVAWALAVPPPRLSLPEGLLMPAARVLGTLGRVAGKEPPLTESRVKLLSEHYAYSIERARREIGFQPAVSLPEGMHRTAEWYIGHGLVRSSRDMVKRAA